MPAGRLNRGDSVSADLLKGEKRHLIEASRELGEIDLVPALAQITAPTVVFAPSRDWFVRREAPHVAAAISGARLTLIPGAGHLWTQRHPTPLNECVRALASTAPWKQRCLTPIGVKSNSGSCFGILSPQEELVAAATDMAGAAHSGAD
jgi:hypothetical protein